MIKLNNKSRFLDMDSRVYYIVIVNFFVDASGVAAARRVLCDRLPAVRSCLSQGS